MAEQHDLHWVVSASISFKMVLYFDGSSSSFIKALRSFSGNLMTSLKFSHVGNLFTVCTTGGSCARMASEAYRDLSCETSLDTESSKIEASFLDSELSSFAPRVMTVHVFVRLSPTRSIVVAVALDLLRVHGPTKEALSLFAVEELFPATLLDT
ncbi:hypothetical protein ACH5RR_038905 [Cinchona calisaya]|uniref:Uncharacterized protein n=1 Tax=Cinchona calisaya TaxID=153742 RepID=A0ABD2XWN0_9GENT